MAFGWRGTAACEGMALLLVSAPWGALLGSSRFFALLKMVIFVA
jgi:hypothetical protein